MILNYLGYLLERNKAQLNENQELMQGNNNLTKDFQIAKDYNEQLVEEAKTHKQKIKSHEQALKVQEKSLGYLNEQLQIQNDFIRKLE